MYKKINNEDEGYLMIIKIVTKPRNQNIDISTCEEEGQIYLYVNQKNCTMNEASNNFCQKCISEYGKYEIENKCYHKSEKFDNLYYDNQTQTWQNCDINNHNFICGICPKGTFIKEIFSDSSSQICEKCKIGEYNNITDSYKCQKCPKGYYSNITGQENCQKCPDGYSSVWDSSMCYRECKNGHYSNGEKCIEDILQCPEGMNYLNLDTGECKENASSYDFINYQYKIRGGENELNEEANKIFFDYKDFPDLLNELLSEKKIKIKGIDSTLLIGYESLLKIADISDISIDFGDCPKRVALNYSEKYGDNVVIKVIDLVFQGTRLVEYHFYDNKNLNKPLDINTCANNNITIVSPPFNASDYFQGLKDQEILQIIKDGHNIFDIYSCIYNNPCCPLSIKDKYDLTLKDRREVIYRKNITVCEDGCLYEGENLEILQVICYCQIKINNKIDKTELLKKGFQDIEYRSNYQVLTCIQLLFSSETLRHNIFFYLFILLLIINIKLIIITECFFLKDNLAKIIEYCKQYINEKVEKENKEFTKLKNIYLKILEDDEMSKNLQRCIRERIFNEVEQRKEEKKKREIINGITNKIKRNIQTLIREKKDNEDNYYIYLIYSFIKSERSNYVIGDELNGLDLAYYRNIENRKWYHIFFSLYINNYDFINTFLIYNCQKNFDNYTLKDYRFYTIKIMIYLNSSIISILINILFYNEKTMHKIYEDDGKYNILYRLPRIFISEAGMEIISILLGLLIDFQDNFIKLRNNMFDIDRIKQLNNNNNNNNNNNINILTLNDNKINTTEREENSMKVGTIEDIIDVKNNDAIKIRKSFRFNRIFFYIIVLIINIFGLYYISCFCAVYPHTQKHLLLDFISAIPMNLISCAIICFLNLILKVILIKVDYIKCTNYLYCFFNHFIVCFLIEKIIEYLLIKLISD